MVFVSLFFVLFWMGKIFPNILSGTQPIQTCTWLFRVIQNQASASCPDPTHSETEEHPFAWCPSLFLTILMILAYINVLWEGLVAAEVSVVGHKR